MNETGMKKILLVEDIMITALAEALMLTKNGYEVISAPDGESAVKSALNDLSIDLILMDIDLGRGIDGPTAADLILKERNLPIVFLTSHSEREIVDKVKSITRYGYVVKNSGDFVILSSLEMAFELFEAHSKTKESEENFRQLAASKNEAYAVCDATMNKLIYTSPAIRNIFKIDPVRIKEGEWLSVYLKMVYPEDLHIITNAIKILHNFEVYTGEYRIICDDKIKWIKGTAYPVYNDSGVVIKYAAFAEDITVRKIAEKDLLISESKFRSYIDNAPIGIVITDNNGKIIEVNPVVYFSLGYSETEFQKLSIKNIIDPSNAKAAMDHFTIVKKEGKALGDILFRKKNGSVLWLHINAVKLNEERFIAFCQDITERKKAEVIIYKSEERMRNIFDNLPIGIFQSTIDGKFVYINHIISEILGYDSISELIEEVNRSSISELLYVEPDKRPVFIQEISSEPGNWKIFNNRYKKKDGTIIDAVLAFCEKPDPVSGEIFHYGYIINTNDNIIPRIS